MSTSKRERVGSARGVEGWTLAFSAGLVLSVVAPFASAGLEADAMTAPAIGAREIERLLAAGDAEAGFDEYVSLSIVSSGSVSGGRAAARASGESAPSVDADAAKTNHRGGVHAGCVAASTSAARARARWAYVS